MSTPTLNATTREIIVAAYRAANIVPSEQALEPFELQRGLEAFNYIIKQWQAQGLHLWAMSEAVLPLNQSQEFYDLGATGAECATADTFFATNLEADEVATDTVLEVFDVSGLTGVSNILSFSPTASTQGWTSVSSGTTASDGTTLTVTNGAASAGGADYTLSVENGEEYLVTFDYTQGTSASADFSVISGTTLDTLNLTATGSGELRFTANLDQVTFRFANGSAVLGEDSDLANLNYQKISSGDRIGIQLDDGTRQWTYLISKDSAPSPPTIRIADALTGDAAEGNIIYSYEDKIDRPLRIHSLRYADRSDRSEIPTDKWTRQEYFDQPDKTSEGTVVQWYYDPQLTLGRLYVWQVASSVNNVVRFTYERPLLVSEDTIDSPDIPSEWVNALKWSLAYELAIEYGNTERIQLLQERAMMSLDDAEGFDIEDAYFQITPDYTGV